MIDRLETRAAEGAFSENTVRRNHRSLVMRDGTKLILSFDKLAHEQVSEEDEKDVVGLFRSRSDYGESAPVRDEARIAELRGRLWEIYRESLEFNRGITPAHAEISPETSEELRKLGYVDQADAAPAATRTDKRAIEVREPPL